MMSKCPAQSTTMFPRRRNIFLAVATSVTAAFSLFYSLPIYHIYTLKFVYDDKEINAQLVWRFPQACKKRGMFMRIFMIIEDKLLKFMYIHRTWITLYRPYFLNGLICSSLSKSENGNKIHSVSKCARNIFLSISERFLTPLTLLTPFRSTENIKDGSEEVQQRWPMHTHISFHG